MRKRLFLPKIFVLIAIVLLSCSCKFPDNLPDILGITKYQLSKIEFGKTTSDEFEKLCKEVKPEKVGEVLIYNLEPENKTDFERVRVGFKDKKLDWIEFSLVKPVDILKFVDIYGKPRDINRKYSKVFDYYDYGFFNISSEKTHKLAKHITIFEIPDLSSKIDLGEQISSWQNLNVTGFLNLRPGLTLESEFKSIYPGITSSKNVDNTESYILDSELGRAKMYYKKAYITFNNGLLSWISLIPQNLDLQNALKVYKTKYKIEHIDSKYDFYDFTSFVLVVDKVQKKVINIGIISAP